MPLEHNIVTGGIRLEILLIKNVLVYWHIKLFLSKTVQIKRSIGYISKFSSLGDAHHIVILF